MSDDRWFYSDAQQQQQGPVSFAQIQQIAASGQIQPKTLIWNEGMAHWTPANQVPGVFTGSQPPPLAAGPAGSPYATPASASPGAVPAGGDYPIPSVKKCSFPLFLILYILGFALLLAALVPVISPLVEAVQEVQDTSGPYEQSPEEAREAQAEAGRRIEKRFEEAFTPEKVMLIGTLGLLGFVFSLGAWVIACIHIYRSWVILQPGGARTTPGKAVGFLFIPFFNLYWVFVSYYGWSQDWNRIQGGYRNLATTSRVPEALFLTSCISVAATLVPVVGYLAMLVSWIVFPIMLAKMGKVVNQLAATRSA